VIGPSTASVSFSASYFSSWSYDSNLYNSGFLVRLSYVWALWILSCLHSKERAFNMSTALWEIISVWSLISCGVSGTAQISRSDNALLELLDYFFKLCHLLLDSFFGLYLNECHREKFSIDFFLYLQLLHHKLFLSLL
jgi:hypothetical protein